MRPLVWNMKPYFQAAFPPGSAELRRAWILTYLGAMVMVFSFAFVVFYLWMDLLIPAAICTYSCLSVLFLWWLIFGKGRSGRNRYKSRSTFSAERP